jgi:hypothetical protein
MVVESGWMKRPAGAVNFPSRCKRWQIKYNSKSAIITKKWPITAVKSTIIYLKTQIITKK